MSAKRPYAVELDDGSIYVGSSSSSPRARFRKHKAGGKTSVPAVRKHGKRLRPDLVNGASTEASVRRRVRKLGYKTRGSSRPFNGPTRRRAS